MRTYDTYKDSGIAWLGQIPSHWEVRRTKNLWHEVKSLSADGQEHLLSVSQYDGITQNNEGSRSESLIGYKIVEPNDLVINIMLAWMGGHGVSRYKGIVSPAYCVYRLHETQSAKYFHYLYRTPYYLAEFARRSTGVIPSRWRMYTDEFGCVASIVPPLDEQEAIVNYLTNAIAKIDEAIAQQQKMIDLLKERKQIIINEAVTHGLDPNVPMKQTGIDWLPQIPAHWEMRKISSIYLPNIGSGTTPMTGNNKYYVDDGINWLQSGDLNGSFVYETAKKISESAMKDYGLKLYPKGSLVIAMYGASIGNLGLLQIETTVNQACCVLCPTDKIIQEYAFFSFVCSKVHLINLSSGGGQPNISQEKIKAHKIPFPPIDEQSSIVSYIVASTNPINFAIAHSERMIELLKERKQIVINDVVTGKIKVS